MTDPDEAPVTKRNRRTDAMFVAAYIAVAGMIYVVVYEPKITEYAQGVITLALGNFIGYLTAMYNFETGTTRAGQAKDATIKTLAEAAPIQTAAAVAAATGTTPPPPEPIKADNVEITAQTATLSTAPPTIGDKP